MRDLLKHFNYKQDHQSSLVLVMIVGFLFILNLGLELFFKRLSFIEFLVIGTCSFYLFKFYFSALKNLHYTFWGLSILVVPLVSYYLLTSFLRETYTYQASLFLVSFVFLALTLYFSSSPVYYPKVSWWEFDYRYRADIPAVIKKDEKQFSSRLTDIRRKGGSIASFENFELGEILNISFIIDKEEFSLLAVTGSKSQTIIGRPYSYGLKFNVKSKEEKQQYKKLYKLWLSQENLSLNKKFEKDAL